MPTATPEPEPIAKRPAIIALHGCGGLYTEKGKVQQRFRDYAARWHAAGWHVLAPDSFTPRGRRQICTERNASRTIKVALRRDDVVAAFTWLAARPDVDASRIALVGWSNGGSTLLEALDAAAWHGGAHPVAAVAFYPGCRAVLARPGYAPVVPLVMLLGANDDWTPPHACEALARAVAQRWPALGWESITYADSVHGFDSTEPVRLRADVPNGLHAEGVHQGGNPVARTQALRRLDAALEQALGRPRPQSQLQPQPQAQALSQSQPQRPAAPASAPVDPLAPAPAALSGALAAPTRLPAKPAW